MLRNIKESIKYHFKNAAGYSGYEFVKAEVIVPPEWKYDPLATPEIIARDYAVREFFFPATMRLEREFSNSLKGMYNYTALLRDVTSLTLPVLASLGAVVLTKNALLGLISYSSSKLLLNAIVHFEVDKLIKRM